MRNIRKALVKIQKWLQSFAIESKFVFVFVFMQLLVTALYAFGPNTLLLLFIVLPLYVFIYLVMFVVMEIKLGARYRKKLLGRGRLIKVRVWIFGLTVIIGGLGMVSRSTIQLNIVAPYVARKCEQRGYPGDISGGAYLDSPYVCVVSGLVDAWEGAVYYPHVKWDENTNEEIIFDDELNTNGKMICNEINENWLWCRGN